jgi:hypothetical protein
MNLIFKLFSLALILALPAQIAIAQVGTGLFRVDSSTGIDGPLCGSSVQPCMSIQQAVNLSATGDEIRVATGTYTYEVALDPGCPPSRTGVICIINKDLTIRGGFSTAEWHSPDPESNPTIIDGLDSQRGLRITGLSLDAGLTLEGFTVTRGLAQGATGGGDTFTFAFGGGLFSDDSRITIRDCTFTLNRALGGDTTQCIDEPCTEHGGTSAGGAVAIRGNPATPMRKAIIDNVVFSGNQSLAGPGPEKGGYGQGGAIWTNQTEIYLLNLVFEGNSAGGGDSPGSGALNFAKGDGLGGAVSIGLDCVATITEIVARNNAVAGGDATTFGGGAFGGAIYLENGDLTITDSLITQNTVSGGNAENGGIGSGGGLMTYRGDIVVDRVEIIDNASYGGDGIGGNQGSAGGGAAYITNYPFSSNDPTVTTFSNSVLAGNLALVGSGAIVGGGGGALFLQEVAVTLEHVTLADNQLGDIGMQGEALVALNATSIDLDYSIVANHNSLAGASAIRIKTGTSLSGKMNIFSNNQNDTNEGLPSSGTINLLDTISLSDVGFMAPGSPSFDYHLKASSQAIDQAVGSNSTADVDNETRDESPDIGADEFNTNPIFSDDFELGTTDAWSAAVR